MPFEVGQRVEVLVIGEDEDVEKRVNQVKELFQMMQALPQAQTLTEEEIEAEIDAYRSGK